MRRVLTYVLVSLGFALAACMTIPAAHSADHTRRGKIAAQKPYEPPRYTPPAEDAEVTYKVHNWYAGLAGGYAWTPEHVEDTWHGGVYGGYLWRPNAVLGLGIEADYVLRDLGDLTLDDGVASVRGRLGVYVAPGTFVYGTAGVAQATAAFVPDGFRKGPVIGGGIEYDVARNVAVRAEVLHYRHGDEYLGWADHGSTAARIGLGFKF